MSTKVFFNESCRICKKEIDMYKKMENNIKWYDIHEKEALRTNLNLDQLTRRLHVIEDGKLYQGAKAFLIVWSKIPKLNFLYKIAKVPGLYHIFATVYEIMALFLYFKNKLLSKKN